MKIAVARDSFKGSMSSITAGRAVETGIRRVYPKAQVRISPLADGGEGTMDALIQGMGGSIVSCDVTGPLGETVACEYGVLKDGMTAVIEIAKAAGLTLIPIEKRNPLLTTTFGVGEAVRHAIKRGCRRFIVGIGGSATNDGGIGMLQALGFSVLDKEENQVGFGAGELEKIVRINDENKLPELNECTFRIACDVTNPLCGVQGASAVYGPQKGATPEMVRRMDTGLKQLAKVSKEVFPKADDAYPGTGAAGGLGFAFQTFLNGALESGVKIIMEETNLTEYIQDADYVITGEGRLDGQTVQGKAPIGVAALAKKYEKPVIAFCGSLGADAGLCNTVGIDAFFSIAGTTVSLEEAMKEENAVNNMADAVEQVFRLLKLK